MVPMMIEMLIKQAHGITTAPINAINKIIFFYYDDRGFFYFSGVFGVLRFWGKE